MTNEELMQHKVKTISKELSNAVKISNVRYKRIKQLEFDNKNLKRVVDSLLDSHFIIKDINDKLNLSLILNVAIIGFGFILYFK